MSRHVYSVLCAKVSVDAKSHTVSMFEVLERLELTIGGVKAIPEGVPFQAMLVSMWVRTDPLAPEKHSQRIRLISPGGKELGSFEIEVDLAEHPRARTFADLQGLRLDGQGWYEWCVEKAAGPGQWTEVARLPLEVVINLKE